jgi:hypothetical protein
LRRRREQTERIEVEADALIENFGRDAYGEARWREQTASSDIMANEWNRVALAVASKIGQPVPDDTASRSATAADLTADHKLGDLRPIALPSLDRLLVGLRRILRGRWRVGRLDDFASCVWSQLE